MTIEKITKACENKKALEIGGPSQVFLPLYKVLNSVDGVNHSNTIWQGKSVEGMTYRVKGKLGYQYVRDALDLDISAKYDVLLASHVLEHIANPIKALFEWKKILKKPGLMILVVPAKEHCFDHKRPITKFQTLIDKYNRDVGEDDLSSLEEILALHDLSKDPPAGTFKQFKARSLKNFENRALHHHVFNFELLSELQEFISLEEITKFQMGLHQVVMWK